MYYSHITFKERQRACSKSVNAGKNLRSFSGIGGNQDCHFVKCNSNELVCKHSLLSKALAFICKCFAMPLIEIYKGIYPASSSGFSSRDDLLIQCAVDHPELVRILVFSDMDREA